MSNVTFPPTSSGYDVEFLSMEEIDLRWGSDLPELPEVAEFDLSADEFANLFQVA